MSNEGIVVGQSSDPAKIQRAKDFRRQMTSGERLLWEHLRGNRLGGLHFRRQQVIDGFIADFYCHSARLIVEVDGSAHDGQELYDAERDEVLSPRDLLVLRIPDRQVRSSLNEVLTEIAQVAAERKHGSDLTPCPPSRHGKGGPTTE